MVFSISTQAHIIVVFALAAYGGKSMNAAHAMDANQMMKMKMTNDNPLARADIPWDVIGQLAIVALQLHQFLDERPETLLVKDRIKT